MKYLELIKESNEELMERYEVVTERVAEIAADAKATGTYADYFEKTAQYLMLLNKIVNHALKDEICGMEEEQAVEVNTQLFADIKDEAYENSYANPTFAVAQFGKEAGQMLSMHLKEIFRVCVFTANCL